MKMLSTNVMKMVSTNRCILVILTFVVGMMIIKPIYDTLYANRHLQSTHIYDDSAYDSLKYECQKLMRTRNELSKLLNLKQQKLGQMECEENNESKTSQSGGWCLKYSNETGGQHMTDSNLAQALADLFKDKNVASFGDGPGRYKQILTNSGKVKLYDAFDGAPFCETTSEGRVSFLDLTLPQYGLPLYDWVLSLEVAEHIPKQFESVFVDNISRHAKEGVVLSWAKLGQGGFNHVNNQPFHYVEQLMKNSGFYHDNVTSETLKKAATFPWFKWNTNVYRRNSNVRGELDDVK